MLFRSEIDFEEYVVPYTTEVLDATFKILTRVGPGGWQYRVLEFDDNGVATIEVKKGGAAGVCAIPSITYLPPAAALQYPTVTKVRFVDQEGALHNEADLFGAADNPGFEPWEFTKEEMAPFLGIDI